MDIEPTPHPRVAFFGGSFDPPHLGHIEVARAAQAALSLDTVLFAPVGEQPLKPQGSTAPFAHRLAMTRLAIAEDPAFALSLADAPKPSGAPNYTFDTLFALRAQLPPDGALFCLMGADAFACLRRWRRAAEIPFLASLIVASRPGEQLDDLKLLLPDGIAFESILCQGTTSVVPKPEQKDGGALAPELRSPSQPQIGLLRFTLRNPSGRQSPFYLLPGLDIDISASQIRGRVRAQSPLPPQLPPSVSEYIRVHGLYL